ncbi:hypothetical protein BT96DRAFT_98220 [Gymnopus androsaceus JB14]|uniref:Uncharacterized protein n=1 Tax=Gymnopus androsaceus JB14 TaxID=1447944 RepID=A0A6A4HG02_9AGAR|nr:hypothetical protein BT96DRAFT_98220 [Gymnopus androsaceus JB14]
MPAPAPQTITSSSLPTISTLSSLSASSSSIASLVASPTTAQSISIVFPTTSTTSASSVQTTVVVEGGGKGGRPGGRHDFRDDVVSVELAQNANSLSTTCVTSLEFPAYLLDNATREDIALVLLQCWVFCIMIFALYCRSISGTITIFVCLLFQFVWSIFRVAYADRLQAQVDRITNAACDGISVLPNIWTRQIMLEAPSIALSGLCLVGLICLACKLRTSSDWQAERALFRTLDGRRLVILHATLQISMFFVMLPLGLWLNDLFTGVSAHLANHVQLYKVLAFIEALVLIPWLIKLRYASQWQDHSRFYPLLFTVSLVYVIGLDLIFIEPTYRLVFLSWPFFGTTSVLSIILCLGIFLAALDLHLKRIRMRGSISISPDGFTKPLAQQLDVTVPPATGPRPISTSSSFSSSSRQWRWIARSDSRRGPEYSPTLGSSIYSSEEAAYRGYISDVSTLPPLQTSLERQLTVKEDSPTLKTPRFRVFPQQQSEEFDRSLIEGRKEGAALG